MKERTKSEHAAYMRARRARARPPKICGCGCGAHVPTRTTRGGQPAYLPGHRPPRGGPHPTPAELHAEQVLHASELVVAAVHDEGPDEVLAQIRAALRLPAPVGVDPVVALITVLAAQVDVDAPASRRLAWLDLPPRTPNAAHPTREEPAA